VVLADLDLEREGPHYFNSLVMVDADGSLMGLYRRATSPTGGYQEKYYFRPGDTGFKVWDSRFGRSASASLLGPVVPGSRSAMTLMGRRCCSIHAIGSEPHDPSLDTAAPGAAPCRATRSPTSSPVVGANRTGFGRGTATPAAARASMAPAFIADHRGDLVGVLGRDDLGFTAATFDLDFLAAHRAAWGFFPRRRPTSTDA